MSSADASMLEPHVPEIEEPDLVRANSGTLAHIRNHAFVELAVVPLVYYLCLDRDHRCPSVCKVQQHSWRLSLLHRDECGVIGGATRTAGR